jgi:two-component system response regulator YesN
MTSVMLVEDEYIVREDLKNLFDWEEHGFKIVAEATNGKEGIEQFKRHFPEVVITDVRMPIMDGLNMAAEILRIKQNTYFILLTAYDDFDYARKALSLGINSYILKHEVDSYPLLYELNKAKRQIIKNVAFERYNMKTAVRKLLNGGINEAEAKGIVAQYHLPIKRHKTVMLLMSIDYMPGPAGMPPDNTSEVDIQEIVESTLNDHMPGMIFSFEKDRYVAFVTPKDNIMNSNAMAMLHSLCLTIQKNVMEQTHKVISISVGSPIGKFSDICLIYDNLMDMLEHKFFMKLPAIIYASDTIKKVSKSNNKTELNRALAGFLECLKKKDFTEAKDHFRELIVVWAEVRDIEQAKTEMGFLLTALYNSIVEFDDEALREYKNVNTMYEEIDRLNNIHLFYEYALEILNKIEQTYCKRYSKPIQNALKYIHENYNKDINLEDLSSIMGVSKIYASQLFKKEVGLSFKNYLTDYRINRAVEFLKSGQYRVYEVSSKVGYQTVQYFCQTFKKVTGKSPSDYVL